METLLPEMSKIPQRTIELQPKVSGVLFIYLFSITNKGPECHYHVTQQ